MTDDTIVRGSPTFVEDVGNALQNYLFEMNISASELAEILDVPDRTMKGVLYREQVVESVDGFYALLRYVTGIMESDQTAVPSRVKRGGRQPGPRQEFQRAWSDAQVADWIRKNRDRLDAMTNRLETLKEQAKQRRPLKGLKPGRNARQADVAVEPVAETAAEWSRKAARALKAWAKKQGVSLRSIARELNISRGTIETIGRGVNVLRDLKTYADIHDYTGLAQFDPRNVPPLRVSIGRGTGINELERQWTGKEEWIAKHESPSHPEPLPPPAPEPQEPEAVISEDGAQPQPSPLTVPVFVREDRADQHSSRRAALIAQLIEEMEVEQAGSVTDAISAFSDEMRQWRTEMASTLADHLISLHTQQEQFIASAAERLGVEWDGFSTAVLNRAAFILKRALNGSPADVEVLVTENKRAMIRLLEYLQQIPEIQPEAPKVPDVVVDGEDIAALMARLDELLAPFLTKERSSADRDRLLAIYREPLGRLFKKVSTLTMSTPHREMVVEEGKVNQ